MDDNDASTHLLCRLNSFQIAVAQKLAWESHGVKWKMWKQSWDFRTFKIHKVEVLRHLRALPTVPAIVSVGDVCWTCRMETGPGFSPQGPVMPHCGRSYIALNSPINKLNQRPSARAGRCRAMTSRCTLWGGQVLPALVVSRKKAPDEAASTNWREWRHNCILTYRLWVDLISE